MFWLWFIVAILLFAVGVYKLGTLNYGIDDKIGMFFGIVLASAAWPLILAAVVFFGPFFGLYWLGEQQREKKNNKNTKK